MTEPLEQFLIAAFRPSELQHLLARMGHEEVLNSLPDPASTAARTYVAELVRALERRALLNLEFFDALVVERPNREREVRALAAQHGYAPATERLRRLVRLLDTMFAPDELRLLAHQFGLAGELPGRIVSNRLLTEAFVEAIVRRGEVDSSFFRSLISARPGQGAEIDAVAVLWGVRGRDQSGDDEPSTRDPWTGTTAASRLRPSERQLLDINDIFRVGGRPEHNLVPPEEYARLEAAVRDMQRGLVVEGPSRSGKTTALRTVIENLRVEPRRVTWIEARKSEHVRHLVAILERFEGYLVIDDFHRIEATVQRAVADRIKVLADGGGGTAKIIVVGIARVGRALVEGGADVVTRFERIRIGRQSKERVLELISLGERAANIRFRHRDALAETAKGSFALAQILCRMAAINEGIQRTQTEPREVSGEPSRIVSHVQADLEPAFQDTVYALVCASDDLVARAATLCLLWRLAAADDGTARVVEVKDRYPALKAGFALVEGTLITSFLDALQGPASDQFFFEEAAGFLAVEDTALQFYLQWLDWSALGWRVGLRVTVDRAAATLQIAFGATDVAFAEKSAPVVAKADEPRRVPCALILKGGGAKGLAFVGAVRELSRYYSFTEYVGTSAGAIAAMLLACGYTHQELQGILSSQDFGRFKDGGLFSPLRLLFYGGLHPGNEFLRWIRKLIADKVDSVGEVAITQIPTPVLIFATALRHGTVAFTSETEETPPPIAAFAVRASMSIPLFFDPVEHGGRVLVDGGLLNNFPILEFVRRKPGAPFVGLYLRGESGPPPGELGWLRLISIALSSLWTAVDGDELRDVSQFRENVVVIDPSPIGTTDFALSDVQKRFLVQVGRVAALDHLIQAGFPVDRAYFDEVRASASGLREEVVAARRQARMRAALLTTATLVAPILGLGVAYFIM